MLLYTLRNLLHSPVRTLQMILGSFMVIMLLFTAFAFEAGINASLKLSSDQRNIIILGTGSEESVERSEIALSTVSSVGTLSGLKEQFEKPAVSPEVHYNTVLDIDGEEREVLIRGVKAVALSVYNQVLLAGNFPKSGEVLVGRFAWKRLGIPKERLDIGKTIVFENQEFEISGHFAAAGSTMESELWMNLGDIIALTRRDSISCIVVRLEEAEFADIDLFCKQRLDLQITAIPEEQYYEKLGAFYRPIIMMAWFTAVLIALGALLGGMNTFYAAIVARRSEFAVLETVGFPRWKLYSSLFIESLFFHIVAYLLAAFTALLYFPQVYLNFGSSFFSLTIEIQQLLILLLITVVLATIVIILPAMTIFIPNLRESLRA